MNKDGRSGDEESRSRREFMIMPKARSGQTKRDDEFHGVASFEKSTIFCILRMHAELNLYT